MSELSLNVIEPETPVTDPVCGMQVSPNSAPGGSHEHKSHTYHFCRETCRRRFRIQPEKYLSGGQEPMDAVSVENTVTYFCPMCEGIESQDPGACPKCGMALEPSITANEDLPNPELRDMTRRMIVGIALGLPIMVLAMTDMLFTNKPIDNTIGHNNNLIIQAILATIIVFWCGWPLLTRAMRSVRLFTPNMFTLIGVGVMAAYIYSVAVLAYTLTDSAPVWQEAKKSGKKLSDAVKSGVEIASGSHGELEPFFESAAGIVVLMLIGQVLELGARRRTGESIRALSRLAPKTAKVIMPNGHEDDIPLELVDLGDQVRIRPGERVPVDGKILEGSTSIDESMLTGESLPIEKVVGMSVLAGTQNALGSIVVEVTRKTEDSVLLQVIDLVGQAQRSRSSVQRTVDKIAAWFVPIVFLVALVTTAVWVGVGLSFTEGDWQKFLNEDWLTYAMICGTAVLIISCPCALGLATPMAIVVGVGRAARRGVLFRDAVALERFAEFDTLLVDKTGTLTTGKARIHRVQGAIGIDPNEVLALAAAIERGSEHPLGLAIVWEAVQRQLTIEKAMDIKTTAGKGIVGMVGEHRIVVGSYKFLLESGVHHDMMHGEYQSHLKHGHGVILVGRGNRCIGLVAIVDPIRPTSAESIAMLKKEQIEVVLVSGDHADTAKAVAAELDIDEVIAETMPAEKYAIVERYKNDGKVVAMAGDGINDAPALAAADIGIAMGSGTDVAMSTAGVTLVRPDLRKIVEARTLSRATVRTIRQNLWLAFGYNILAIPVAAGVLVPLGGGLISPVWAAAAMSLSSISVILNSLRLGRKFR